MEFRWENKYSNTLEPDNHNRWARNCYCTLSLENFKDDDARFIDYFEDNKKTVLMATIVQKGTENGSVPSLIHKYCCNIPSFKIIGTGFSDVNLFSNDIEDLKKQVEDTIIENVKVFSNFV